MDNQSIGGSPSVYPIVDAGQDASIDSGTDSGLVCSWQVNPPQQCASNCPITLYAGTITAQAAGPCEFPLSEIPTDLSLVQVAVDCNFIQPDSASAPDGGSSGWTIDFSNTPPQLKLAQTTCESFQDNARHTLLILNVCCPLGILQ